MSHNIGLIPLNRQQLPAVEVGDDQNGGEMKLVFDPG
jgi:hypothetical protein